MGLCGGAPAAPDYTGAATADSYSTHGNVSTPWGRYTSTPSSVVDPSTGKEVTQWNTNISLDPTMQASLDQQQGIQRNQSQLAGILQGNARNALSQNMDWGQFGSVGTGDTARDQAIQASYGQATSRLDPQWQQQYNSFESGLRNQGLDPGDALYDQQMGNMGRARTDAYQTAMNNAISTGNQAQAMTYGQNMQSRQQAIAEALQRRSQPLNEMQSVLTGQQVGMPSFPGAQGQASNMLGAANSQYGANVNSYNAGQAQQQDWMNMLGKGAGILFGGL